MLGDPVKRAAYDRGILLQRPPPGVPVPRASRSAALVGTRCGLDGRAGMRPSGQGAPGVAVRWQCRPATVTIRYAL
jgi:hypothetical protein